MLKSFQEANIRMSCYFFREGFGYKREYMTLIEERVKQARITLDLGAGRMDIRHYWELEGQSINARGPVIAVDMDLGRLARNPNPMKLAADARRLPFADGSIDMIVSESMFEHLDDPQCTLVEVSRALKRGGALVFATPCKYSYISIVAAITPLRFHTWHARLQRHDAVDADCCQTLYRLNTERDIRRHSRAAHLNLAECARYVGAPCYTLFLPPPLHFVFIVFHKLVERFSLTRRWFAINLVGVLEKP